MRRNGLVLVRKMLFINWKWAQLRKMLFMFFIPSTIFIDFVAFAAFIAFIAFRDELISTSILTQSVFVNFLTIILIIISSEDSSKTMELLSYLFFYLLPYLPYLPSNLYLSFFTIQFCDQ